jgi:hypothetical protein
MICVRCYPTLDQAGLEFSPLLKSGGLVSPVEFASMIGGIFPIALCGRSSLWCLRHAASFSQASCRDRNQCAFRHSLRSGSSVVKGKVAFQQSALGMRVSFRPRSRHALG